MNASWLTENTRKVQLNFLTLRQDLLLETPPRLAVAFSGGRDSVVLLDLLAQQRKTSNSQLFAFHIHHGLQAQADTWLDHCASFASARDIPFFFQHVEVKTSGQGIEAAAREARYAALRALAQQHQIPVIALAHHAQDQAETVLFNLARGAGSRGLAGMPLWREEIRQNAASLRWWRPLLNCSAEEIAAYAQQQSLHFIHDPSNDDIALTRNHLRHRVLPALQTAIPRALSGMTRAAGHAAQAAELELQAGHYVLQQLRQPLESPASAVGLPIVELKKMPSALRNAALRAWLLELQLPLLSLARLNDWWRQISSARPDAQMRIKHGNGFFCCYRGVMYFQAHPLTPTHQATAFWRWQAHQHWALPQWQGEFVFTPWSAQSPEQLPANHSSHTILTSGIPEQLLFGQVLQAKPRQGGERLRLQTNGHSRSLKQWYQHCAIPPWQRNTPLLYLGDELLFVPGVGLAAQFHAQAGAPRWVITWRPL